MSRRHRAVKRIVIPDSKFNDPLITKFMNSLMYGGKKSVAESIFYGALDILAGKGGDPLASFRQALSNVAPSLEVRSRRVGGADQYRARLVRYTVDFCIVDYAGADYADIVRAGSGARTHAGALGSVTRRAINPFANCLCEERYEVATCHSARNPDSGHLGLRRNLNHCAHADHCADSRDAAVASPGYPGNVIHSQYPVCPLLRDSR